MNKVKVGNFMIGEGEPLTLLAGPCVLEGMDRCLLIGRTIKEICGRLGINYVFKASFDKANRSSYHSFRGPGLKKGLEMLQEIKETLDVPIVTDIHETTQAEPVAKVADIRADSRTISGAATSLLTSFWYSGCKTKLSSS